MFGTLCSVKRKAWPCVLTQTQIKRGARASSTALQKSAAAFAVSASPSHPFPTGSALRRAGILRQAVVLDKGQRAAFAPWPDPEWATDAGQGDGPPQIRCSQEPFPASQPPILKSLPPRLAGKPDSSWSGPWAPGHVSGDHSQQRTSRKSPCCGGRRGSSGSSRWWKERGGQRWFRRFWFSITTGSRGWSASTSVSWVRSFVTSFQGACAPFPFLGPYGARGQRPLTSGSSNMSDPRLSLPRTASPGRTLPVSGLGSHAPLHRLFPPSSWTPTFLCYSVTLLLESRGTLNDGGDVPPWQLEPSLTNLVGR